MNATGSVKQFELEWFGGASGRRFRRRRPRGEDLPWGTLDPSAFEEGELDEARSVWTNGAFTEYASAAAFSAMTSAFLECGAPIDLVATAADFVVDEMRHAELAARLIGELGGAAPYEVDLESVSPQTTVGARALMRAAELVVKTSCVGEALSVSALSTSRALARHPLVRAVLSLLLRDEGPHARIGFSFLSWAADELDAADRAELAEIALDAIEVYAPLWHGEPCAACPTVLEVGRAPFDAYRAGLVGAVRTRIAAPLARHGIETRGGRLEAMLA